MSEEVTTDKTDNQEEASQSEQDNGTKDPGYMAAVKADLREKYGDELRNYENINPIIEDYFTLKAKSEEAIFKPKEGATEEEVAKYKEKMDIPSKADGYELEKPPEELGADYVDWFKDIALTANLSKPQAKAVYEAYNQLQKDVNEQNEAAKLETEKQLRKELGSDYDSAISNAQSILKLGGEDLVTWLNDTGAGNDPRFVKAFAKLGSLVSEDSVGTVKETKGGAKLSLAERLYPTQK